ncbi:MAG: hypothetical protein ACOYNR_12450 [Blastocatellia bacterium]|jgi:hypothetical protein
MANPRIDGAEPNDLAISCRWREFRQREAIFPVGHFVLFCLCIDGRLVYRI